MQGMNLDPNILIQTQANMLAQNAIQIAQLEAAVQQLGGEVERLQALVPSDTEVEEDGDASTG